MSKLVAPGIGVKEGIAIPAMHSTKVQSHARERQRWGLMGPKGSHVLEHIDGTVDGCQTDEVDGQALSLWWHSPFVAKIGC